VEEQGNTACTGTVDLVRDPTRSAGSERSLRVVIGANQQREQLSSSYAWRPDDRGSVDEWYGFSMLYAEDWDDAGGLREEVDETFWHNPIAFRVQGPNGSLNLSGDRDLDNANGEPFEEFAVPHLVLRRNTVLNEQGFYDDGLGLDKIDLGPIVTGEWMDVVCHIRWSTTEQNALRECWRDGEHRGSSTSVNAVSSEPHRLRVGQYQTTEIGHRRTTYYDNVRVGTSYAAVDPSRDR
jgi:hypothetical protein